MITKGTELNTFIINLNGGAEIDADLADVLVDNAKAILEEERSWMVLRKTNTALSVTTGNTWQTSIPTSSITDFSRFYGEFPVQLTDGADRTEYYRLVPFDRRLAYKNVSNTFVYDENAKIIYLNGNVPFSGTLYINYVSTSTAIDLTSEDSVWSVFPSRFLPVLGFYAIGIFKGAIDYDSINRQMLPENRATLTALKGAMEKWDNEKQLSAIEHNDPTDLYNYPRGGAINRSDE